MATTTTPTPALLPIDLSFYQYIWEHPDDDAPRLVFADWLEDDDNPKKDSVFAEYIRRSVELYRLAESHRAINKDDEVYLKRGLSLIDFRDTHDLNSRFFLGEYLDIPDWIRSRQAMDNLLDQSERRIGVSVERGLLKYYFGLISIWIDHYSKIICHHPINLAFVNSIPYRAVDTVTELNREVLWTFGEFGGHHSSCIPLELQPYIARYASGFSRHPGPWANFWNDTNKSLRFTSVKSAMDALSRGALEWARDKYLYEPLNLPTILQSSPTPDTESGPE